LLIRFSVAGAPAGTSEYGTAMVNWRAFKIGQSGLGLSSEPSARRILCIEDEPEMIDLIRLILRRRSFIVEGAEGGRAGLQAVNENPPDLILLDLMMPDMDGWDVYQQLKATPATSEIPVIVVTARAQAIDRAMGLQIAKVDDYIVKPFSPQHLLESVERVLAGRTGDSQSG
jgi:two-component system response regulator VicR